MSKPRFRSPLRNEWSGVEQQFAAMGKSNGRDGAMARLMCDIMPAMIEAVERERDLKTAPADFFDAVAAAAGAMIEEAIETRSVLAIEGPTQSLDRMLRLIHRVVSPRVAAPKKSRLITQDI
jgi:hypothetical protein